MDRTPVECGPFNAQLRLCRRSTTSSLCMALYQSKWVLDNIAESANTHRSCVLYWVETHSIVVYGLLMKSFIRLCFGWRNGITLWLESITKWQTGLLSVSNFLCVLLVIIGYQTSFRFALVQAAALLFHTIKGCRRPRNGIHFLVFNVCFSCRGKQTAGEWKCFSVWSGGSCIFISSELHRKHFVYKTAHYCFSFLLSMFRCSSRCRARVEHVTWTAGWQFASETFDM